MVLFLSLLLLNLVERNSNNLSSEKSLNISILSIPNKTVLIAAQIAKLSLGAAIVFIRQTAAFLVLPELKPP